MTTNEDLANALREIGDLLDLQGEKFKPEAYRRAARSIEALPEDIRAIAARGELDDIPGIGAAISEKSKEFLASGRIEYLERLRRELPAGVIEIMRLPGLGPKTARRFLVEFGVEGPAELEAAIAAGTLNGVKGFGPKKIGQIRDALAARATTSTARLPILDAWRIANRLVERLRAAVPVERLEVAGSLRRRRETIGDLDILATSGEPEAVFDAFTKDPEVATVRLRGPTKETVLLTGGVQVDLRVVEPAAFGAALVYFTGSKDHNVRIRTLAKDAELRVNEYGVYRGEERIAGTTEEEVYAALGFPWIPPEIRENQGEIEAASTKNVPTLVEGNGLLGEFHVHDPFDAPATAEERLREARRLGWTIVGLVVPEERLAPARDWARTRRTSTDSMAAVRIGVEIGLSRSPTLPPGADFVLARPESAAPTEAARSPGSAAPIALVHIGRAGTAGSPADVGAWVRWATEHAIPMEVNPRPAVDGIDSSFVRRSVDAGGRLHLSAGVNGPDDRLDDFALALGLARRGWARPESVINRRDPTTPGPPERRSVTGRARS